MNRQPILSRLGRDTLISETGCWMWQRSLLDGYGRVSDGGNGIRLVHRLVYEKLVGPIPAGLVLDHLCRNRACCNPDHLEPVTLAENIRRGVGPSAINVRKTHCLKGHAFVAANTYRRANGGRRCRICTNASNVISQRIRRERNRGASS